MKTLKELKAELDELGAKSGAQQQLIDERRRVLNTGEMMPYFKARREIDELYMVAKHNYVHMLYTEVLPVALELFNGYEGKPFGEKTEQKFKNAFRELYPDLHVSVRIDVMMFYCTHHHVSYVEMYPVYHKDVGYKRFFDKEKGRPCKLDIEDFRNPCSRAGYIENPVEFIEGYKRVRDELEKMHEQLSVKIDEFSKTHSLYNMEGFYLPSVGFNKYF